MMFRVKRYVQNTNECSKNSNLFLFQDNPELHAGSKVYRLEASAGGGCKTCKLDKGREMRKEVNTHVNSPQSSLQ